MNQIKLFKRLGVSVAGSGLLLLAACGQNGPGGAKPEAGDRAVAVVGQETVWASDVKREAVSQGAIGEGEPLDASSDLFRRTLDEVIDQKLLYAEAMRQGLDRDAGVRRRLQAMKEKQLGDVLVGNMVDKGVNEQAIRALFEEQQKTSKPADEVKARQIVVATQPEADAIRKLLATGASFEALAMQRSTDAATRFNGGDLGFFTLDAMPEAYGAALKVAKVGEVVGPIKTEGGFAVMRVDDRRLEQPISMEEARPQIVRFLTYDQIRTLLTRLRGATKVQTLIGQGPQTPGLKEPASAPAAPPISPPRTATTASPPQAKPDLRPARK